MLFNLLLTNITILLCFLFSFRVIFNNVFTTTLGIENAKLKLALTIPTRAPITSANDAVDIPPLLANKQLKIYQNSQ